MVLSIKIFGWIGYFSYGTVSLSEVKPSPDSTGRGEGCIHPYLQSPVSARMRRCVPVTWRHDAFRPPQTWHISGTALEPTKPSQATPCKGNIKVRKPHWLESIKVHTLDDSSGTLKLLQAAHQIGTIPHGETHCNCSAIAQQALRHLDHVRIFRNYLSYRTFDSGNLSHATPGWTRLTVAVSDQGSYAHLKPVGVSASYLAKYEYAVWLATANTVFCLPKMSSYVVGNCTWCCVSYMYRKGSVDHRATRSISFATRQVLRHCCLAQMVRTRRNDLIFAGANRVNIWMQITKPSSPFY